MIFSDILELKKWYMKQIYGEVILDDFLLNYRL